MGDRNGSGRWDRNRVKINFVQADEWNHEREKLKNM